MWILSQDKMTLRELRSIIAIHHDIENDEPNAYEIWCNGANLATYSTKDKALKVLDEIRQRIVFNAQAKYGERFNTFDTLSAMENTIVYQMPQDDEVK